MRGSRRADLGLRTPIADAALRVWLRDDLGLDEYRRVVRASDTTVVISKFEAGFAPDLFATLEAIPELLDDGTVAAEYARLEADHLARGESPLRTAVWRDATEGLLNSLGEVRGIDARRRMYVLPGIESVQAVIDGILWSAPVVGRRWSPSASERAAFEEFARSEPARDPATGGGRDIFTRYYGYLLGRSVENYCPGAQFARRLVAQAWKVCTGEPP